MVYYGDCMKKCFNFLREKLMKGVKTPRILAFSFIFVIIIGSLLLSLSISNNGENVKYIEHLFTAVSATCVTGLLTVNISTQYTIFGQIIIICLMQIGGLGLMTFLIMFLSVAKKQLYFAEKKLVQDALNKSTIENIPVYIKSIFKYTLFFEMIGVMFLSFKFCKKFGFARGVFNAIFLSVSAFCNAGMDNFSLSSLEMYKGDLLVNVVVCFLIVVGGLGFAVWFDLFNIIKNKKKSIKTISHHFTINTKLVVKITAILIFLGAVVFYLLENNWSMNNLNVFEKIIISIFNSVTLRTAGFSSIPIGNMKNATLLIMCLFMLIGGSPGGTAGGIKTTTFGVLLLSIKTIISNKTYINYHQREISQNIVNKAFIVFTIYLVSIFISVFFLLLMEPKFQLMELLFETISAIATVGLSVGITPDLTNYGKIIIMIMMFIGRVGPITIIISTISRKTNKNDMIRYSQEDVLIG